MISAISARLRTAYAAYPTKLLLPSVVVATEAHDKYVAKQLREWSKFLTDGKSITINITFYYSYVDAGKTSRGGATANQEADLEARTAGIGRGACIRKAYMLMRCPGRPCAKGSDYC